MSTLPEVAFFVAPPATLSTGVGAGAGVGVTQGVTQPGPKKPAAAGVPGDSGAVAVATTGQSLASDADTVRDTRRPSLPTGLVAASTTVGFLGVPASLGVRQFFTHMSQTRFGAVYARRACIFFARAGRKEGWGSKGRSLSNEMGEADGVIDRRTFVFVVIAWMYYMLETLAGWTRRGAYAALAIRVVARVCAVCVPPHAPSASACVHAYRKESSGHQRHYLL